MKFGGIGQVKNKKDIAPGRRGLVGSIKNSRETVYRAISRFASLQALYHKVKHLQRKK